MDDGDEVTRIYLSAKCRMHMNTVDVYYSTCTELIFPPWIALMTHHTHFKLIPL